MGEGSRAGQVRHIMLKVEIDSHSGFCGGVIRAIGTAEKYLSEHHGRLCSLGAIVHNDEELSRLRSLGLVTVGSLEDAVRESPDGTPVLIRAHGEPPEVYRRAAQAGISLIDCTCPVVLRLQKAIKEAYSRVSPRGGSIVIFGKTGHPEVLGLVGQVPDSVYVVPDLESTVRLVESGSIAPGSPVELFSQTTMSPTGYGRVAGYLRSVVSDGELLVHSSICSQVEGRHRQLAEFASGHDVIVFVAGSTSSNGKVLSDLCRSVNPATYRVGSASDLDPAWFPPGCSVGVCGATSTPKWLLENVAHAIENLQ